MSLQSPVEITLDKYIEVSILGERPHIRERRIPVATIAHSAQSQGWSISELAYQFTLSEMEVLAALLYYKENESLIEEQETAYQQELDKAQHEYDSQD